MIWDHINKTNKVRFSTRLIRDRIILSHSLSPFRLSNMSDLPFTLDQLRILKAIAAEGSFKRAADSLYVSQPAVSLQVQNLERQLDVPLFDRGGRRAQLTEAGHLLLSYGEKNSITLSGNLSCPGRFAKSSRRYVDCGCLSNNWYLSHASDDWVIPPAIS